jgi:hypothetical protein
VLRIVEVEASILGYRSDLLIDMIAGRKASQASALSLDFWKSNLRKKGVHEN